MEISLSLIRVPFTEISAVYMKTGVNCMDSFALLWKLGSLLDSLL